MNSDEDFEWSNRAKIDQILYRRTQSARLDPFGCYLAGMLDVGGFWDNRWDHAYEARNGRSFFEDTVYGPVADRIPRRPDDPMLRAVAIAWHLKEILSAARASGAGRQILLAEEYVAGVLLDYFEHCARPAWVGRLRVAVRPGNQTWRTTPGAGDPIEAVATALAWWDDYCANRDPGWPGGQPE